VGVFEGSKHDYESRITKNKMADPINVKDFMFPSRKANPLLDGVGSLNMAHL
jgi:hypothetical protein